MHIVNKICTLADGSDIKLEKSVALPVKINNVTYNVRLYILPVKHLNMIIGCDLLTRLAATIHYKHNVLVIENCGEHDTVPCTSENMLGQLEERKSKSVDLLSTGNHWLRPGYSCNMVLKTKKNIDYVSENTIVSKLPLHIKLEDTLKSNKEVITKVTNNTTTPILIMDKENIATLQDKDISKIDNVRVSLNDKIKDIDLSSSDIKDYQKEELIRLLNNFTDMFSTNLQEIGRTNLIEYDVEVDLDVKHQTDTACSWLVCHSRGDCSGEHCANCIHLPRLSGGPAAQFFGEAGRASPQHCWRSAYSLRQTLSPTQDQGQHSRPLHTHTPNPPHSPSTLTH